MRGAGHTSTCAHLFRDGVESFQDPCLAIRGFDGEVCERVDGDVSLFDADGGVFGPGPACFTFHRLLAFLKCVQQALLRRGKLLPRGTRHEANGCTTNQNGASETATDRKEEDPGRKSERSREGVVTLTKWV